MIKSGIKNYFTNLKHFFTPIGTLAVGMFIGISIFIPGAIAVLSSLIQQLSEILQDASIDFGPVKDSVIDAVKALDWGNPIASLKTMLSRDWLIDVITSALDKVSGGLQPYADAISDAVGSAVDVMKWLVAVVVAFCIIGLVSGYFLTRFLVRRNMARRTFKKFLVAEIVDSFVTATLIALSLWLVTLWAPSIFITSILSLVIFAFTALVSAYLVHGKSEIDFKTVINYKNILKLLATNAIIFIMAFAFLLITVAVTNVIAGILIGFSFVEIAFIVMSLNAENYVINLPRKAENIAEEVTEDAVEEKQEEENLTA